MGIYRYIRNTFIGEYKTRDEIYKNRLQRWRKEPVISLIEKPTNIASARNLGYKAKEGYYVVRVRTKKGKRARKKPRGGRKPGKNYKYKAPGHSYQVIAEQKASRRFPQWEVLNSYWVGEDGKNKFYEVIMIDPEAKGVIELKRKGRAFRGLTSAGRKSRGMRSKGRLAKKPVR